LPLLSSTHLGALLDQGVHSNGTDFKKPRAVKQHGCGLRATPDHENHLLSNNFQQKSLSIDVTLLARLLPVIYVFKSK